MPDWANDLVVVELRRHAPEGVGKDDLHALTGLGTEDLREALQDLAQAGRIEGQGDGTYVYVDPTDVPAGESPLPIPEGAVKNEDYEPPEVTAEEEALAEDGPTDEGEPVSGPRPPLPIGATHYRARIYLETVYRMPEDRDTPEDAVGDARELAEYAASGILTDNPDLVVTAEVESVERFGNPETIYSRGQEG